MRLPGAFDQEDAKVDYGDLVAAKQVRSGTRAVSFAKQHRRHFMGPSELTWRCWLAEGWREAPRLTIIGVSSFVGAKRTDTNNHAEFPTSRATPIPRPATRSLVDGQNLTFGGTSAVAPLWAGLMARINQKLGRNAGFINTILYQNPQAFNDITSGSNTDYNAGPGWDPCTGLGSPKGAAILQALSGNSGS